MLSEPKTINYHGWKIYEDYSKGYGPYFLNTLMKRIHKKMATNVVITGEAGVGKSYLAMDICRLLMGFNKHGKERFSLDQVVFTYKDFMDAVLKLPAGHPIIFDEPSYSMGKRDWYKQLNKALVQTVESFRFKRHPFFLPIINKSLLDKTIRDQLLQFLVVVNGRGKASVYRIRASQFVEKTYHRWFCNLEYGLFDSDRCSHDSCLDCTKLIGCDIFRARYEKKKEEIQSSRYAQARDMAEKTEAKQLTMKQLENFCVLLSKHFIKKGKIKVSAMRLALQDEYGVRLSNVKAYELKEMLLAHHPEILDS